MQCKLRRCLRGAGGIWYNQLRGFPTLFWSTALRNLITDFQESLGFDLEQDANGKHMNRDQLVRYVNLKLMVNGLPLPACAENAEQLPADNLVKSLHQRLKLLDDTLCPADRRIEIFLQQHFADVKTSGPLQLPRRTIILDRHGLAREMSLPQGSDNYSNALVSSYRVRNGVLHNPRHDRRATKGTFQIAAGGLPVPRDKVEVPKPVFAELLRRAVAPPDELLELPFTNNMAAKARSFVTLLLRPLVRPAVPDVTDEKTLEIRFFVPGSLVSNLDFVESVFGNAGDPFLPGNDAGLDPRHWTGHTGCVILAPHPSMVTKRAAGLPHYDNATERQRRRQE